MKKKHWLSSAVTVFLLGSMIISAVPAFAADSKKPGMNMDIGIQVDGRVLVPLRDITEQFKAQLTWDAANQSITINKDETTILLKIGETSVQINGKSQVLDVPPQISDNQTFVPLRLVSEAFGAKVEWNEEGKYTKVETKENELYINSHPYLELDGVHFVYDGEMDNGLPHGKGTAVKGTSLYGEVWYQGQWSHGKPLSMQIISSSPKEQTPSVSEGYQVYINSGYLKSDYAPITRNDAVYLPLWDVLGKLNISAEPVDGIVRINLPSRILLLRADSNLMSYYGRSMDPHSARLKYQPISENDVIYVPLVFLTDYMDMKVAWGEQQRIDITAEDLSKNASWGNKKTISDGIKQLKLETDAEAFWKSHPVLWVGKLGMDFSKENVHEYQQVSVISYNGAKVTISNGSITSEHTFNTMDSINRSFYTSDPLADIDWPENIKALVREGIAKLGMSREQAVSAWGQPSKINKTTSAYGDIEQWVYRGIGYTNYLYFTNGILSTIQK
jgi:hypothetical protein